jgi:hypothetical protein
LALGQPYRLRLAEAMGLDDAERALSADEAAAELHRSIRRLWGHAKRGAAARYEAFDDL